MSIHTLRKACAQNWASNLPINVVKELMGHSSIATTQKFYLKVTKDDRAKVTELMDSLLSCCSVKKEKSKMTDAQVTPEGYLGRNCNKGQF